MANTHIQAIRDSMVSVHEHASRRRLRKEEILSMAALMIAHIDSHRKKGGTEPEIGPPIVMKLVGGKFVKEGT